MRKKKKYNLGTIELGSEVYVSDPCYNVGTWCQALVKGVKPGKYHCHMYKSDFGEEGLGGIRVTDLWVVHESTQSQYPNKILDPSIDIGVDSGAAGIYDKAYFEKYHLFEEGKSFDDYPEAEEWYDKQFELRYYYDLEGKEIKEYFDEESHKWIRNGERADGVALDEKCVISFSGWGDGGYSLYVGRNRKKEITSLRIKFI